MELRPQSFLTVLNAGCDKIKQNIWNNVCCHVDIAQLRLSLSPFSPFIMKKLECISHICIEQQFPIHFRYWMLALPGISLTQSSFWHHFLAWPLFHNPSSFIQKERDGFDKRIPAFISHSAQNWCQTQNSYFCSEITAAGSNLTLCSGKNDSSSGIGISMIDWKCNSGKQFCEREL